MESVSTTTDRVLEQIDGGTERFEKGQELVKAGLVKKIPKVTKWQLWKVASQTTPDKWYNVVDKGTNFYECDCPDFERRQTICKHVMSVIISEVRIT